MAQEIKGCANCKHHRRAKPRPLIRSGTSPRQLDAYRKWIEAERERERIENINVDAKNRFDYEPYFWDWCESYTPSDVILKEIKDDMMRGSDEVRLKYLREGKLVSVDPQNGEVSKIFALCVHQNPEYNCPKHEIV